MSNRKRKLTWSQVCDIRTKWVPGSYPTRRLAREYKVSASTIWRIVNRLTWKTDPDTKGANHV